ncbi:ATP synthase F1 subunit epsilon [Hyphomicrobium sp.]|uniref:ATP synthase F1 subunit epsilon n=1 Tax=Hyphomicrobium sp. TaxID=82 RepID=UPI003F6FA682
MAQTFTFELVSPEKVLLAGEAEQVQLPGAEGDMTILPGHSPLISTLRPGVIDVMLGGARSRIYVRQAFAQVEPDRLTVLAEKAQDVAELTGAVIAEEVAAAEAELAQAKTDEQRLVANQAIAALSSLRG